MGSTTVKVKSIGMGKTGGRKEADKGKEKAPDEGNVKAVDKGKGKSGDKGKRKAADKWKSIETIVKPKKIDKGKGKLVEPSWNGKKKSEKDRAIDKGKSKVDRARSGDAEDGAAEVGHAEDEDDDPYFIASDYDLRDHDEDAIMAVQVEGWQKVVDVMENHTNEHVGDTSDNG